MLFQVYGENALYQWIGWAVVFVGLILINEIARRTKVGGVCCFIVLPIVLTVYFVSHLRWEPAWARSGRSPTPRYVHMNSWFHYAKLYAATIGCIGFMALKYKWGKHGQGRNGSSASRSSSWPSTSSSPW